MRGSACLAIWFRVDADDVAELDAWYPRQHLPERLSVPGFLRGRRYAAVDAHLPYLTIYETEDATVLSSAAYVRRLNDPTPWTRRVLPTFRTMVRGAYRLLRTSPGDAVERHVLTAQIKPDSGRGPYVHDWLDKEAAAALDALTGVGGCALYMADSGGTAVVSEERKLVGGDVLGGQPFLAVLEVTDAAADGALRDYWTAWGRKIAADVTLDSYRLMYGLGWI